MKNLSDFLTAHPDLNEGVTDPQTAAPSTELCAQVLVASTDWPFGAALSLAVPWGAPRVCCLCVALSCPFDLAPWVLPLVCPLHRPGLPPALSLHCPGPALCHFCFAFAVPYLCCPCFASLLPLCCLCVAPVLP